MHHWILITWYLVEYVNRVTNSRLEQESSELTLRKPYSVSATNAMGTVEMKTPAMGIKLQRKTNIERSPIPGICKAHIPRAVSPVFAAAIRAYISQNPLAFYLQMRYA